MPSELNDDEQFKVIKLSEIQVFRNPTPNKSVSSMGTE
jgi:hypothetical protein